VLSACVDINTRTNFSCKYYKNKGKGKEMGLNKPVNSNFGSNGIIGL
jgi:hypothetical protein